MSTLRYLWSGRPSPVLTMVGGLVLLGVAELVGSSVWFALVVYVVGLLIVCAVNAKSREQDRRDAEAEADG